MIDIASPPRRRFFSFVLGLLATAAPLLAFSPASQWNPADDHHNALTDRNLVILWADLLANDTSSTEWMTDFETNESITVELVAGASAGSAMIDGKTLIYTPAPDSHGGIDRIRYRLRVDGVPTGEATVVLYLSAPIVPVAGRWPTKTCNDTACPNAGKLGDGAEIGFFDAELGQFVLCDWVVDKLEDCAIEGKNNARIGQAWRPLVGDWDGDGWDELAAHDPSTGELVLIGSDTISNGDMTSFDTAPSLSTAEPGLLISGDWFTAGYDLLGLFRPTRGNFLVETLTDGFQEVVFGDDTSRLDPLPGNWNGFGVDQLSIWDHDSRTLYYLDDDFSYDPGNSWQPIRLDTGDPIAGIPFNLGTDDASPTNILGFYDPIEDILFLTNVPTADCRFDIGDPSCGTLPMQIPVDPGGGGSTTGGGGDGDPIFHPDGTIGK